MIFTSLENRQEKHDCGYIFILEFLTKIFIKSENARVWIVYTDNSQSMENYNILKFIDTCGMISFDNSYGIISTILTWMSVGLQFLNHTYTFLMLQINASIMWYKILHTYQQCKLFFTKNAKFTSLERSYFSELLSCAIFVLFDVLLFSCYTVYHQNSCSWLFSLTAKINCGPKILQELIGTEIEIFSIFGILNKNWLWTLRFFLIFFFTNSLTSRDHWLKLFEIVPQETSFIKKNSSFHLPLVRLSWI